MTDEHGNTTLDDTVYGLTADGQVFYLMEGIGWMGMDMVRFLGWETVNYWDCDVPGCSTRIPMREGDDADATHICGAPHAGVAP